MRRAVGFLTVVSVPGGAGAPSARDLRWFPVVGAGLGLGLGGVWWLAQEAWSPMLAAAVVVVADLAVTGLLHFDGLADAADGMLGPMARERRLEVMATPDVGAFAVSAVAAALLLRTASLASLDASPLLLGALWAGARTVMAVAALTLPYARSAAGGGLASPFLGGSPVVPAVVGAVLVAALAAPVGVRAWAGLAVGALAAAALLALAVRRLGGFTGDVLGAAGILAETAALVTAAARW